LSSAPRRWPAFEAGRPFPAGPVAIRLTISGQAAFGVITSNALARDSGMRRARATRWRTDSQPGCVQLCAAAVCSRRRGSRQLRHAKDNVVALGEHRLPTTRVSGRRVRSSCRLADPSGVTERTRMPKITRAVTGLAAAALASAWPVSCPGPSKPGRWSGSRCPRPAAPHTRPAHQHQVQPGLV
jgi:hypothetical protein